MTKQTKSLGGLADLQASPPPTPETTEERIDRLERRLLQVETLLNDVTQQLDKPYRDQQLGNGEPHRSEKPKQVKQVKPKQVNPQLAKPKAKKAKKAKKAQTPPSPATEVQTQADNIAITTFLSQDPDKLWHGAKLRSAIQELCSLSNQQVASAIKHFRQTGHLVIEREVEVDGQILNGAYQFIPQPETPETPDEKQAKEAAKRLAAKQAKQARKEKNDALVIAQKATTAQLAAEALEKLLSILDNGDRITTKELIDMGISKKQQQRMQKSDAYKESGIQYQKLPDENYEYWIEPTS